MDLSNAKVLITGGTSGIGFETAKMLKSKGAEVVICGRNKAKVDKASKELDVLGFVADVSNENKVKELVSFANEKMNGLNVLINNAGLGTFSKLVDTSLDDFQKNWEVNTKGLFLTGREAAKHFVDKEYGNIINIGSTAANRGFAQGSAYVASKFAVSGLTDCWRIELRPHNIRVMQINPSEVITNFFDKMGIEQKDNEYKLKPSEIAHVAVSMLAMDDVGFIPSGEVWATNPNRK